jgi:hypothetical protein
MCLAVRISRNTLRPVNKRVEVKCSQQNQTKEKTHSSSKNGRQK